MAALAASSFSMGPFETRCGCPLTATIGYPEQTFLQACRLRALFVRGRRSAYFPAPESFPAPSSFGLRIAFVIRVASAVLAVLALSPTIVSLLASRAQVAAGSCLVAWLAPFLPTSAP